MPTPAHTSRVYPWPQRAESALSIARVSRAEEVEQLFAKEFDPSRPPRSQPYKQGVRAILEYKLAGKPLPKLPFALGTVEADAYFAGQNEGRDIVRAILLEKQQA
jgi:hypothetical protein